MLQINVTNQNVNIFSHISSCWRFLLLLRWSCTFIDLSLLMVPLCLQMFLSFTSPCKPYLCCTGHPWDGHHKNCFGAISSAQALHCLPCCELKASLRQTEDGEEEEALGTEWAKSFESEYAPSSSLLCGCEQEKNFFWMFFSVIGQNGTSDVVAETCCLWVPSYVELPSCWCEELDFLQ